MLSDIGVLIPFLSVMRLSLIFFFFFGNTNNFNTYTERGREYLKKTDSNVYP